MQIYRFDTLPSTSDHLREMAEKGAPSWTVVIAGEQTAGRGRQGRSWHSPAGNLYLSVLARPAMDPSLLPRVPMAATLALARALGPADSRLTLKWPNDLLFEDRKLAGVLSEARTSGSKLAYVIMGFGVNVRRRKPPVELAGKVAWVEEFKTGFDADVAVTALVEELVDLLGGLEGRSWQAAMREWSSLAQWGRKYIHRQGDSEIEGVTVGLDRDGGLIMDTARGRVTVVSGELV